MSLMSNALTTALSTISDAKAESLSYATTVNGSYTALDGFVIHQDRIPAPVYDDLGNVVKQRFTGYLKGPVTPLMVRGYFIKDSKPATALTWAVEGIKIEEQQIVTIWREERAGVAGPDRGASA